MIQIKEFVVNSAITTPYFDGAYGKSLKLVVHGDNAEEIVRLQRHICETLSKFDSDVVTHKVE